MPQRLAGKTRENRGRERDGIQTNFSLQAKKVSLFGEQEKKSKAGTRDER